MQPDGAGEYTALEVPAFQDYFLNRFAMRNATNVLFNNRSLVEFFGDVVACGADQFHSPLVSLVIGFPPGERREK